MQSSIGLLDTFIGLRARLVRMVRRIVPPEEVEDIVQETYVRVCQFERKSSIRNPQSFLFRTAQNLALDHVKRAGTRLTSTRDSFDEFEFDGLDADRDCTFNQVATDEEFAQFCEAVRRLPKQCRRAFVLKKVYGYSQREIAATMGISVNVVENYIATGIKRCELTLREFERPPVQGNRAIPAGAKNE